VGLVVDVRREGDDLDAGWWGCPHAGVPAVVLAPGVPVEAAPGWGDVQPPGWLAGRPLIVTCRLHGDVATGSGFPYEWPPAPGANAR
jgi:hypothetical protein